MVVHVNGHALEMHDLDAQHVIETALAERLVLKEILVGMLNVSNVDDDVFLRMRARDVLRASNTTDAALQVAA